MNETKKPYNHHAHNHQLGVERIDFSFAGWLLLHKISIHWLNIKARKRIIKYIVCSHISHWPVNFNDDVIRIFSSWFFSRKNNLISLLQGFLLFFIFIFYFFGNLGETVLEKQKKKRLVTTWTTCVCVTMIIFLSANWNYITTIIIITFQRKKIRVCVTITL